VTSQAEIYMTQVSNSS